MNEEQAKKRKEEYASDVLAHIAAHQAKGETEAVQAHLAVPKHKAIVDAAKSVVVPPVEDKGKGKGTK